MSVRAGRVLQRRYWEFLALDNYFGIVSAHLWAHIDAWENEGGAVR